MLFLLIAVLLTIMGLAWTVYFCINEANRINEPIYFADTDNNDPERLTTLKYSGP